MEVEKKEKEKNDGTSLKILCQSCSQSLTSAQPFFFVCVPFFTSFDKQKHALHGHMLETNMHRTGHMHLPSQCNSAALLAWMDVNCEISVEGMHGSKLRKGMMDLHIAGFTHKVLFASVLHKVVVAADETHGLTGTALPHHRTCAMVLCTGDLLFMMFPRMPC